MDREKRKDSKNRKGAVVMALVAVAMVVKFL
jgi:hypothetical protein